MKTIHHVVDVGAHADAVFGALTTQEGLAGWWSTQVEVSAVEVGAVIHFTFEGDFNPDMEITEYDAPTSVAWKCVGGHDYWADNTFRFEVEPRAEHSTRLRFWQHYATELSDDDYGIYNFNWGYYLKSLLELVATGTGKPFEPSSR